MVELVIADSLAHSLTCPACHRLFARCSLSGSSGGLCCPYCSTTFPVAALLPRTTPSGLKISNEGQTWRLEIGRPALLVAAAGFVTLTIILADYGHQFSGLFRAASLGPQSDPASLATLPFLLVIATVIALLTGMAQWLWGRHRIELTREGGGTVFKGLATVGTAHRFFLPMINGICLVNSKVEDHRGNLVEQHIIRLEGIDFYLEFAHDLPEPQRLYIPLALLEKRLTFAT